MNKNNSKHNRFNRQSLFAIIVSLSMFMVGIVAWQPKVQANVSLQPMTLTVVALNGTQIILNQNEIGNLTSYRAYGGFKESGGTLSGLGNYTGVPIKTFLSMIGGIGNCYSVKIIASDNYSQTLSYPMLNGTGLNTYNNVTGALVQHNQTLTPMLAYYYNDKNLTSGGPLRLAIVGPEGLCTDSRLWVSSVVKLEVHPNLQPMNLTLVALNGTSITLNQTAISNLPAIRSVGARRNQLSFVSGLGNYTGPSLSTLCNLVGGMNNNTVLRITATDNYTQTLSYDMVNGAFTTYNLSTGNPTSHHQSLTPILAYYFNDANLTTGASGNGPLLLAIIGPEGLATAASYWVKWAIKLEILAAPLPSLPSTVNLTIIALNGTEHFLNSSQIAALPSTTAQGGYNAGTAPFSTYNYTGVSLKILAELVGGLNSSEVLMVEGSDGYTMNFTYSQIMSGNFSTFNSTTGNPASPTKQIVPIVAYYNSSQLIPGESNGGSGPLMVAIVGNDSLVTQGKYWVKWVVKLEVLRASSTIPEFSSVSIVSLFVALTLVAVASSVWLRRKSPKKLFFNKT